MNKTYNFFVECIYDDGSEFHFEVKLEGRPSKVKAELMMITRGTLMASSASKAIAYNDQGFDECAYTR